jgi:predicted transcriptional regulator
MISSLLTNYKDEKALRKVVDLRHAKIKYSNRVATGENFIQIQHDGDTLLMAFENVTEFDKWALCFHYQ